MRKFTLIILIITSFILIHCQNDSPKKSKIIIQKPIQIIKKPSVGILTIDLIPFYGTPKEMVQDLLIRLKKVNPNIALRNPIAFPINAYYEPRNRYKADSLIYFLKQITIKGHVAIGLTNKDISSSMPGYEDWGVMGLSYMPGKACIVSSFRLNKNNISDQLFKVAIHELGHTQGLHHCATITCLMRDAEGKNTTDQEKEFCPKCKSLLISKGWMIN